MHGSKIPLYSVQVIFAVIIQGKGSTGLGVGRGRAVALRAKVISGILGRSLVFDLCGNEDVKFVTNGCLKPAFHRSL